MLKKIRLAALAAVLLMVAAPATTLFIAPATAQTPAAAPAAPAAPAAAEVPAAPAAPKAPAAKAVEVIDNPYGLEALWKGGDIVAKITLAILVIMSLGSWYIIVTKIYEQSKMNAAARSAHRASSPGIST